MELNSRFAFLFYLPNYNHHPKNAKRKENCSILEWANPKLEFARVVDALR